MKKYSQTEQDLREIHGDDFADELDAMMDEENEELEEEYVHTPTIRERMLDIVTSPLLYWVAGFIDGMLVLYVLQQMGYL